eukprot:scaffold766_cov560-Prasinococcus_capsulatus_cf.AAC.5
MLGTSRSSNVATVTSMDTSWLEGGRWPEVATMAYAGSRANPCLRRHIDTLTEMLHLESLAMDAQGRAVRRTDVGSFRQEAWGSTDQEPPDDADGRLVQQLKQQIMSRDLEIGRLKARLQEQELARLRGTESVSRRAAAQETQVVEELTEALRVERMRHEAFEEELLALQTELTSFNDDVPRVRALEEVADRVSEVQRRAHDMAASLEHQAQANNAAEAEARSLRLPA